MNTEIVTIEDLLETLAGLKGQAQIQIESKDATIMYSIARQVYRGIALTDRQYDVVKQKLEDYKDQFLISNFDSAIETLRSPLRHIDRSKYIKLEELDNLVYLKIRFPFSKKLIVKMQEIVSNTRWGYHHTKGSHEHLVEATEVNVFNTVEAFKESNFEIEAEILEYYEKLLDIKNNKENYVPGIYNYKLKNLQTSAIDYMISSIGDPNKDNIIYYRDRKESLGLEHFDEDEIKDLSKKLSPLTNKILFREKIDVFVSNKKYTINQVVESLIELDRFPLLVMLDSKNLTDSLHQVSKAFSNVVSPEDQSVVFRLDNDGSEKIEFNQYIKDHNLNSPVDKSTKIVYNLYNNKGLPKPVYKAGWEPITVLYMTSHLQRLSFDRVDLKIHFDETSSQMMRFQKDGIQEL